MKNIKRNFEISLVDNLFFNQRNGLIKIDGRRRVGKTKFVEDYIKDKKDLSYSFSFIGNNKLSAKENLYEAYRRYCLICEEYDIFHVKEKPLDWQEFFANLLKTIKTLNKKVILFFDEVAWFDKRSIFINSFSNSYNLDFANQDGLYIFMATSVSSWFKYKLETLSSFYARFSLDLTLKPFKLEEIYSYCKSINPYIKTLDVIKYYLMFGGIVKYYSYLDLNENFEKNLANLIKVNNFLQEEMNILFDNLFSSKHSYQGKILEILAKSKSSEFFKIYDLLIKDLSLEKNKKNEKEIRTALKSLVDNHLIIETQSKENRKQNLNFSLSDQFIYFNYYWTKISDLKNIVFLDQHYSTWKGNAFEITMLENKHILMKKFDLKNVDVFLNYRTKKEIRNKTQNYQIDLLLKEKFKKEEKFFIIECKCYEEEFKLNLIEKDKIKDKIETLKYILFKDLKNKENEINENIEPIFVGINKIEDKERNYKTISICDYLENLI